MKMRNTCATCLSQDRRLIPLKSIKFKDISLKFLNMGFLPLESLLCWECVAMLARYARFRRRALHAQTTLRSVSLANTQPSETFKCLSTLTVHTPKDIIHVTSLVYAEDDVKPAPDSHPTLVDEDCPLLSVKAESSDIILDDHLEMATEPFLSHDSHTDTDTEKTFAESPILRAGCRRKNRNISKYNMNQTNRVASKHKNLRSTKKRQKCSVKRRNRCTKIEQQLTDYSSSDDTPLARIDIKTKEGNQSKKRVRFEIPSVSFKVDAKCSDTESAFTDSDIGIDQSELDTGNYSSSNKYNRDKFETRNISYDRMLKNRELDKRSKEYQKSFKCEMCIKGFDQKIEFAAHMDRYHSKLAGAFKCPVCGVRFTREPRMRQHYVRHLQSYNCRKCHFFHHNIRAMYQHDQRRHGANAEQTFICRHCAQEFPTPATLSYHVKRNHSRQLWNVVMDRKPKKSYFVRKHEHDPDKLPRCRFCQRTFLSKSYLIKHERSHLEPSPRQERECPHCGCKVRFLAAHIKKVHERNENAYCAECDIQFSSVFSYRHSHLKFSRRHNPVPDTSKRTIPCPYCDKKWSHQRDLDRHVILIHTKEYPFICELCGKGFYFERLLKNHVAEKHDGIPKPKNKICTYCGKAFVHLQVLKQHIRVHTGEKPYECGHCPWKFSQRTSLVTHIKGKHPEHFGKTVIRKKKRQEYGSSVTGVSVQT